MKFPDNIPVFGDVSFRGKCPPEHVEQASFFGRLRREFPTSHGLIAVHPRNEGLLVKGQFQAVAKHRMEGMAKGAADIVIPGLSADMQFGAFVCELKRADHTLSAWQEGQVDYLEAAQDAGAFACIGLGASGAWAAFERWAGLAG